MGPNGSPMPDTCIPMNGDMGFDGEHCMNSCPIVCGENDIVCKGGVDSNGCKMADTCVYADPSNPCPIECPVSCSPGFMPCPGAPYGNSCPMPTTCIPETGQIGTDGYDCPAHCPVVCPADQMICPGLGFDATGCKIADFCAPKKGPIGINGNECPMSSCPIVCPPGELSCPGGVDENGCPMPDVCRTGSCDPDCKDKISAKKCQKRKKNNKCGKNKNKKNCKLTCGYCQ